jgi:hypothetical protein
MRCLKDDMGQLYTIEGVVASLILLSVLLFVIQANSVATPQTEKSMDMQLFQKANDVVINLDLQDSYGGSQLKLAVAGWDDVSANNTNRVPSTMRALDGQISPMMSNDTRYNLDLIYYDSTGRHNSTVIQHGMPGDNSVTATRMVTLNKNDTINMNRTTWKEFPQVVEVKITCWYL